MPAITQPFSIVAAVNFMGNGTDGNWLNGPGGGLQEWIQNATRMYFYTGANLGIDASPSSQNTPLGIVAIHQDAQSFVQVNTRTVGGTSGTTSLSAGTWTFGNVFANPQKPQLGFLGIYQGDIRAHAAYGSLKSWIGSYYNIVIN